MILLIHSYTPVESVVSRTYLLYTSKGPERVGRLVPWFITQKPSESADPPAMAKAHANDQ